MVSSHSSYLKDFLELWESVKDLAKIAILEAKHFHFVLWIWFYWHVLVLISYLKDKTDVAKVASFIQCKEHLFTISPKCLNTASIDKENTMANCILSHDGLSLLELLVGYRGSNICNQLVISLETKFLVFEKDIKLGLEWLKEVVFDNLDLHVFWNLLIEFIFGQECIWAVLEISESILSPVIYHFSRDFFISWQLPSNFDNKVLNYLDHIVGILSSRNLISLHKALNFLDGHWVKQHSYKLDYTDHKRFCWITLGCRNISKTTCWQCCGDEVKCDDVLLVEVKFINTLTSHPGALEVLSACTKHDLRTSENVKVDKSW